MNTGANRAIDISASKLQYECAARFEQPNSKQQAFQQLVSPAASDPHGSPQLNQHVRHQEPSASSSAAAQHALQKVDAATKAAQELPANLPEHLGVRVECCVIM